MAPRHVGSCRAIPWRNPAPALGEEAPEVLLPLPADERAQAPIRDEIRRELGISSSARLVLCVGRLAFYKRQDLVIESLGPICHEENIVVVFAGSVDSSVPRTPEMLCRIDELVAEYEVESRVIFLGQRSDTQRLMIAADLLVHATTKEAFGLVLVEALAVGLPVVSSNVEGIPEVLSDTDSILVLPNDSSALRQAVLEVLSRSPEKIERAKEKGERRAALFSQESRTEKMIAFFESIVWARRKYFSYNTYLRRSFSLPCHENSDANSGERGPIQLPIREAGPRNLNSSPGC